MTRNRRSHGATCQCGHGRGFKTEDQAMRVYWNMVKHLGLTDGHNFYQCAYRMWHWDTRGDA